MSDTREMPTVDVYAVGLLYASVCAPETMSAEVLEHAVNAEVPTGIDSRWRIADADHFADGAPHPHPCEAAAARLHWLMSC